MQEPHVSLIRRDDTFLGVCQALGDDFGFHPNILRIAFGLPLIFAPTMVLAIYFGLGAVVLVSRILAPRPRRQAAEVPTAQAAAVEAQVPIEDQYPLPIAA